MISRIPKTYNSLLLEILFEMRLLNLSINFIADFCPHLGSFYWGGFLITFRPIKDNNKFGTDPTMEDQIRRTNNWIYKTKKSNLDRLSGPAAQRIEALSLYGSR